MPKPDPNRIRRTATCAAVFDEAGRILLHRRTDNGRWCLPGGSMEIGETAKESIVREVKEETGFDIVVERLVAVYSTPSETTMTYPNGDVVSYVSILVAARPVGGAPIVNEESSAVDWFDPQALPEPFHEAHRPRVQDAVARREAGILR